MLKDQLWYRIDGWVLDHPTLVAVITMGIVVILSVTIGLLLRKVI